MSTIEYANVTSRRAVPCAPVKGDGYGDKLPTSHEVRIDGDPRWRKVFAICWSNAASFYVTVNGARKYVRDSALTA